MMWDMRGGDPNRRYDRMPPTMDRGYPMPAPGFPAGPMSPPPFYAPNGPGPLTSVAPSMGPSMSAPMMSQPSQYAAYQPEHHHREHRKHSKHRSHDPQVIVQREVPPPFPTFVNQGRSISERPPIRDGPPANYVRGRHRSDVSQHPPPEGRILHTSSHHTSHHTTRHHHRSRTHSESRTPHRSHSQPPQPQPSPQPIPIPPPKAPRPRRSSSTNPYMTTAQHVPLLPIPSPSPSQMQQHEQIMNDPPDMPEPRGIGKDLRQAFKYSKCTGRKKALCVGINYMGQKNELRGCINDAKHVRKFLIRQWGYKAGDIVLLTDDARDPRQLPTKKNIQDAMRWLVSGAKCHDALFFHYSGHGGQTKDLNGDETDGYDEVIFPVDYQRAGHIVDDDLNKFLVKTLPLGCRLTALFDSCHSGTALDLPYIYHSNGRLKGSSINSRARQAKSTPADVISWCACKDEQTSADTTEGGVAVGAMSYAFMLSLSQNPNQTYSQLLKSVREILVNKYSQKSQLSSSHPIDTHIRFLL